MEPILYVLIFLTALLAFEGVFFLLQGKRLQKKAMMQGRLRKLASGLQESEDDSDESILHSNESGKLSVDGLLDALRVGQHLRMRMYRAGLSLSSGRFLLLSLALALGSWALAHQFLANPLFARGFVISGLFPWLHIGQMARKRAAEFEKQFPDALELLIRALRAGHSMTTGLQMAGEELPDPIGGVFAQASDEIQLGNEIQTALANMSYRIESEDLPFFVTAVAIQRETGSNLVEVLTNLAYVIRERFKIHGKVRALTSMGRASANLLALWPVFMVGAMYFSNPDYIMPLFETEAGHAMLMVSAVMIAVGYVLCRKMAKIRV